MIIEETKPPKNTQPPGTGIVPPYLEWLQPPRIQVILDEPEFTTFVCDEAPCRQ